MFRNQIDPIESDSPQYSDSFDLLLAYGTEFILSDGKTTSAQQKLPTFLSDSNEDDFLLGLGRFEDDVQTAINYLFGPATINPDPESPNLIPVALGILDNCVLLALFLSQKKYQLGIPVHVTRRIETMSMQVQSECTPPCHRLVPLNPWRIENQNNFPLTIWHHLPWYDVWTKIPQHTPEQLAIHWQEIIEENDPTWLDIPVEQVEQYLKAIKKDDTYFHFILERSRSIQLEAEIVAGSVPIRLAALSTTVNMDTPLPDLITDKGFQAVACAVMTEPISSWQEKYERLLLAGLFGPDLNNKQRMDLFKKVAVRLDENLRASPGTLMYQVHRWKDSPLLGRELLNEAMHLWLKLLNNSGQKIPKPVSYLAGAFEDAVATLLSSEPASLVIQDLQDEKPNILDIAIKVSTRIIELLSTSGEFLATPEPIPTRGSVEKTMPRSLSILKEFDRPPLSVQVVVEKSESTNSILVKLSLYDTKQDIFLSEQNVTLMGQNVNESLVSSDTGEILFELKQSGNYLFIIGENEKPDAQLRINIK